MVLNTVGSEGNKPIKIAIIITRADELGGAQVHVRDLAAALIERGMRVTVLSGGDGILFEQLTKLNVPYRKLTKLVHPIKPWKDWSAYHEIRSALVELKPDLVTTHSNKAGLLGRMAARTLRIPVIHTSHGFLFSGKPGTFAGYFYRQVEMLASRLGDKVIAVANSEIAVARKYNVIPIEKIVMVQNGLPVMEPPCLASPASEPPRLVMVARFARPKDHYSLLKALGRLKTLPWALQLIGDGAGRTGIEKLAEALSIRDRVSFSGACEDVPGVLADSQIFVLSSKREGFPLSILEAMRAGLPVVASNVGGISEAVIDGETGLLFPPGDTEKLTEKLAEVIKDPQLRQEMGKAGYERFVAHFRLEQMVEKTISVYSETLEGKTGKQKVKL